MIAQRTRRSDELDSMRETSLAAVDTISSHLD
jgi:hypothetical protein